MGAGAPRRVERDLVEDGRLEVDAPPPGRQRWGDGDLQGNLRDLNGHRCRPGHPPRLRTEARLLKSQSPAPGPSRVSATLSKGEIRPMIGASWNAGAWWMASQLASTTERNPVPTACAQHVIPRSPVPPFNTWIT